MNYYVKNNLISKIRFRQKFRQIKVNFGKVQVKIGTVLDADLTKSGEILGQYKLIFLTKYCEILDSTGRIWDSTRQILGQYKAILLAK